MTRTPDFDELVGTDLDHEERERLERVHELLVTAGPPPELTPEMERGPTLAMTLGGPSRRRIERRVALLAAALARARRRLPRRLPRGPRQRRQPRGRAHAQARRNARRLRARWRRCTSQDADPAGNWPMTLSATGLPKLPPRGYYEVFLTRNGKIFAPCGSFLVKSPTAAVSVQLNAPYDLHRGDGWVVTKQLPGQHEAGPVVLDSRRA